MSLWGLACILLVGSTHSLAPRDLTEQLQSSASPGKLELWRSQALPYRLQYIFSDVELLLSPINQDRRRVYVGPNSTFVQEAFDNDNALLGIFISKQWFRSNKLPVFNDTYVGIYAQEVYKIGRHVKVVDPLRCGGFILGLLVFYFAPNFVRHAGFYYAGGISTGLIASILVIAIIFYRVAPKKVIGIPIILGGWAATGYMMQFAYDNIAWLTDTYRTYVIGYFATWIVAALAYCYYSGPPTDVRSFNILQWALQAAACLSIYLSVQMVPVSATVITLLILGSLFPQSKGLLLFPFSFIDWLLKSCGFLQPIPRRFLSQREYEQQTRETTELELTKLKEYCRSPDANWRSLSRRVSNPKKLARFADGFDDHITKNERQLYALEPEISEDDDGMLSDDDADRNFSSSKSSRSASFRPTQTPSGENSLLRHQNFRKNAATSSRATDESTRLLQENVKRRRSLPVHRLDNDELVEVEISLLRELETIRRQKHLNSSRSNPSLLANENFLDEDEDDSNDSMI